MSGRRVLSWLLIVVGMLCLGAVALQTVEARRFQDQQATAFARATAIAAAAKPAPERARHVARLETGALIGMLDVPRLQLSTPVVEGDDDATLDKAVGHLPDTPLPWQPGNSAVAAHRDGLFRPLRHIAVGDEVVIRAASGGVLRYRVRATSIVAPDDLSVLNRRERDTLTLITCYPFAFIGHAPQRFIVHAERQ